MRFTPDQIDKKLNALIPTTIEHQIEITKTFNVQQTPNENCYFVDDKDFNIFRVRRMLDFINPSNLTYDEWLKKISAWTVVIGNSGVVPMTVSKTASFNINGTALTVMATTLGRFITSLHLMVTTLKILFANGVTCKQLLKHQLKMLITNLNQLLISLKPNCIPSKNLSLILILKKISALEHLKNIETFDSDSIFSDDVLNAAAIAPILLKILGERNFLLYICTPTRAGKTTALCLAASAVGDEKNICSFYATKNGLAGAAADVSKFAFLVDEKQVADSGLKEQLDALNGVERTKLNKDSTLRKLHDRHDSTLTRQCD